ncbi:MAG: galactokinase [Anaerolineales bacterium]
MIAPSITASFRSFFHASPTLLVRAPGRVNLIGEHTDYNEGFVLPMALELSTWIALRPRPDDKVLLHSLDFHETLEFSLSALKKESGWGEYVKGVAWALQETGYALQGWEGVMASEVPIGAGLSSSAALEVAIARAFAAASSLEWDGKRMALLCQKAENEWVGVGCGIMDQMVSALAQRGHALFLDCRSLETRQVPFPPGVTLVVMDTNTRRELAGSAYNERREQCTRAAHLLGVPSLRHLSSQELERRAKASGLDEVLYRRARHVVSENERVQQAIQALEAGDVPTFGTLLNESHRSLDRDFEVTGAALNGIVTAAWEHPACYGARMTGAGFGGCALALVKEEAVQDFMRFVGETYRHRCGREAAFYPSHPAQGVECFLQMVTPNG